MTPSFHRNVAFGLLVVLQIFALTNIAFALDVGDRAPEFAAPRIDGDGSTELSEYRGKVVYLDFWASWCSPCLVAIPEVESIRNAFSDEQFQILAINLDQKKSKALRFLSKHPVGYPSLSDPQGRLPVEFGLETMPTSYLIDRQGIIRYVHRGFRRGDGSTLRQKIQELLESGQ